MGSVAFGDSLWTTSRINWSWPLFASYCEGFLLVYQLCCLPGVFKAALAMFDLDCSTATPERERKTPKRKKRERFRSPREEDRKRLRMLEWQNQMLTEHFRGQTPTQTPILTRPQQFPAFPNAFDAYINPQYSTDPHPHWRLAADAQDKTLHCWEAELLQRQRSGLGSRANTKIAYRR